MSWISDFFRVRKLRREHDRLHVLCGRLTEDLKKANREAAGLRARNDLFSKCLRRANAIWMKAHLGSRMWPDGADNIVWLLERLDTYEQGLREAVEKLGEAHTQYLSLPRLVWSTYVPAHLLELYYGTHTKRKGKGC